MMSPPLRAHVGYGDLYIIAQAKQNYQLIHNIFTIRNYVLFMVYVMRILLSSGAKEKETALSKR